MRASITKRVFLGSSCILTACSAVLAGDPIPGQLRFAAADQFWIGAAVNEDQIHDREAQATQLVKSHFNSITPENLLKWEPVHPEPDRFDFAAADRFVEFGELEGMKIIGHTLVWHQQTPEWVFQRPDGEPRSAEELRQILVDHILAVAGRYRGRIHGWDVVNEAVEDDGSMRSSPWFTILGPDYIDLAFQLAEEADPNAELYYNDYNTWMPAKRDKVVELVRQLQNRGRRVDGIGMQGHWGLDYPSLQDIEDSINAFADLGVKVMITELDVDVLPRVEGRRPADPATPIDAEWNPYPDSLPADVQQKLAARYRELFQLLTKHRETIDRVTLWGVHDGQSWRNDWPIPGRTNHPLLFDRDFQPKPAFHEVMAQLESSSPGNANSSH